MPRTTTTLDIAEEYDRVDSTLDDIADELVALEADIDDHGGSEAAPAPLLDEYETLLERGQRLEADLAGLEWALDPDTDGIAPIEQLTVGALTAGDHAVAVDRTEAMAEAKADEWGLTPDMRAANQSEFAAAGLVDAPFLDGSESHADVVGILADCAPQFVAWLAREIDDRSTPDIEGNSFSERVAARRQPAGPDSPGGEPS